MSLVFLEQFLDGIESAGVGDWQKHVSSYLGGDIGGGTMLVPGITMLVPGDTRLVPGNTMLAPSSILTSPIKIDHVTLK